jgi:hypothetical protein
MDATTLDPGVIPFGLIAHSPDESPRGQVTEERGCKQASEQDWRAKIISVGPRQGKWIGIRFDRAGAGGTRTAVVTLDESSNRGTPAPVRVGEELHLTARPVLEFIFAALDFAFRIEDSQIGEHRVMDAVCAELESLLRQLGHLRPIQQGLFAHPASLAGPLVRFTAESGRQKDRGWQLQPA